jgi:hypothetical protein
MPFTRDERLRGLPERCICRQTVNAHLPVGSLAPVSGQPAAATQEGFAPLAPGQVIPLVGERRWADDEPCHCGGH